MLVPTTRVWPGAGQQDASLLPDSRRRVVQPQGAGAAFGKQLVLT